MPLHVQPLLRARQAALEAEGLIQTRDSTLVTIQKTKESLGQVTKVTPLVSHVLRGNKYTAGTLSNS